MFGDSGNLGNYGVKGPLAFGVEFGGQSENLDVKLVEGLARRMRISEEAKERSGRMTGSQISDEVQSAAAG